MLQFRAMSSVAFARRLDFAGDRTLPLRVDSLPPAQPNRPTILRVSELRRRFGRVPAVDGVDLTVREGEIYGFLGVNGAGKTTTIRMLMGIIAPDGGAISMLGETSSRTTLRQKRRIGYVSQEQTFYPWMTCTGLGRFVGSFYPTWDAGEFARLLRALELPPDRKAGQLSGGMRAKLALALALASRPALLILDEPTAGLDPVARREFLDLITAQARNHGRTTLFSSHLIDEVERAADQVGIIHAGRMRYEGPLAELRDQVRRVRLADVSAAPLPPGFTLWRDESVEGARIVVLKATAADWAAVAWPGAEISRMTLEDIFIACVGASVAQL
jgi:ABC-2 type transport system ATP-binding protein